MIEFSEEKMVEFDKLARTGKCYFTAEDWLRLRHTMKCELQFLKRRAANVAWDMQTKFFGGGTAIGNAIDLIEI